MLQLVDFIAQYVRACDYAQGTVITSVGGKVPKSTHLDTSAGNSIMGSETGKAGGHCFHLSKTIYNLEEVTNSRLRMHEEKTQLYQILTRQGLIACRMDSESRILPLNLLPRSEVKNKQKTKQTKTSCNESLTARPFEVTKVFIKMTPTLNNTLLYC